MIAMVKKKAYRKSREEAFASPKGMWKAVKHAQNQSSRQHCLPNTQRSDGSYATEPKEKIEALKKALISGPHSASISDPVNFKYPNDLSLPRISQKEILQTGEYLRMNKTPGSDQILNKVMKVIMPQISSHLEQIFNNSFSIDYYPAYFKEAIIIITRKEGGNMDFISPKNNRPMSLFNTVEKIMEAVLAARISYMATTHNLLPKMHFGGRRGLCVKTAIHYLLEKTYAAWNENQIASLLMMDISATYPNTSHKRLLPNLPKRGLI